jgi:thymidylate kinase
MIKISFSGISHCGKTSLVSEVKKILSLKDKVGTIEEINGKNPFDNDIRSSFISQFFYLTTQINEENSQSINPLDFLLCDRSILDQWIFWKKNITGKEMTPELKEKDDLLKNLYQFWIKTYDLIFFIRVNLEDLHNREIQSEFQTTDLEHLKKTEEIFMETIKEDNLDVIEIWNNSTIDEGAYRIIKAISDYKESNKPNEPAS